MDGLEAGRCQSCHFTRERVSVDNKGSYTAIRLRHLVEPQLVSFSVFPAQGVFRVWSKDPVRPPSPPALPCVSCTRTVCVTPARVGFLHLQRRPHLWPPRWPPRALTGAPCPSRAQAALSPLPSCAFSGVLLTPVSLQDAGLHTPGWPWPRPPCCSRGCLSGFKKFVVCSRRSGAVVLSALRGFRGPCGLRILFLLSF